MPNFVSIYYTYACSICGAKYKDTREDKARLKALKCEEKGKNSEHVFRVGDMVMAPFSSDKDCPISTDHKVKIVKVFYQETNHEPMYMIKTSMVSSIPAGTYPVYASSVHKDGVSGIREVNKK